MFPARLKVASKRKREHMGFKKKTRASRPLSQISVNRVPTQSGSRDPGSGIRDQGSGSGIEDPGSGIRDPGFGIRDQGSGIRDPGFGIRDQGSRIRDTGSCEPQMDARSDTVVQVDRDSGIPDIPL